ncbi:MAG: selenium-dependent molybdenum cofactor biosynthesis protein YqeB [Oscillospiraceae bacterium]
MVVLIKGAGDIASGIAYRLFNCGFNIVMTDIEKPTTVRCTVAFSTAVYKGTQVVEGVTAERVKDCNGAKECFKQNKIAVIVGEAAEIAKELCPDVFIDAVLAKYNTGTNTSLAPIVIGIGPGFTAGADCHAAVETKRGHTLGRVILSGTPIANTGIPGNIGGFTSERIIRAGADGAFIPMAKIGDMVQKGDIVAWVGKAETAAQLSGVVRGMLPEGTVVTKGMKSGDIDPRGIKEYCYSVSDKALAVAGGTLEAILYFTNKSKAVNADAKIL